MKKLTLLCALALGACANLSDPTTAVATMDSAYATAVAGEIAYTLSGNADRIIVANLEGYREQVHSALDPLNQEIIAGQAPTSDAVLAAQLALNALQSYMTANGISTQ